MDERGLSVAAPELDGVIGRDTERAAAERILADAVEGARGLLIRGDAGIGKSTIWQLCLRNARDRGFRVLAGRASGAEAKTAFATLGDLFGGLFTDFGDGLPAAQRQAIEIALFLSTPGKRRPDPRAVAVAVLGLLRQAMSVGPLAIGIDDIQWLDRSTASVLAYGLRRLDTEPVAIVACQRSGWDDPVRFVEGMTDRRATQIVLGPLSLGAMNRLLRTRVGGRPALPTLQKIHAASGGNPFYALEIARELAIRGGAMPGQPLPVPDDLRHVLLQRIERLPHETRRMLLLLSILAQPTLQLLRRARSANLTALDAAVEGGVIEIDRGSIRFTHPLLAAAITLAADPERLCAAHTEAAALGLDPEERARHLALASPGPDASVAAELDEAASCALERGAIAAAADLAELARTLTPPDDPEGFVRRSLDAADHYWTAGDTVHARVILEETIGRLPAGDERAAARRRLALMAIFESGPRASMETSLDALHEATDPRLRAEILVGLAYQHVLAGSVPAGLAAAMDAQEILADLPDEHLRGLALSVLWYVRFLAGDRIPTDMDEIARDWPDLPARRELVYTAGLIWTWVGAFEPAREDLLLALDLATERQENGAIPVILLMLAELDVHACRFDEAAHHADLAWEAADLVGQDNLRSSIGCVGIRIDAVHGKTDRARERATVASNEAEEAGHLMQVALYQGILGFIALSHDRPRDAAEHLDRAIAIEDVAGLMEPNVLHVDGDAIEAWLATGDEERAAERIEQLARRGTERDLPWPVAVSERCRALLLASRGCPSEALAHLDAALVAYERLDLPLERARTLLVRGQIARRAKRWGEARAALDEALQSFEQLGARLWAERARAELGRVGGRRAAPAELTETERRVAELVAGGMTNPEVAEALFLSTRSVSSALTKVFRKLGVRNRAALAAKVTELAVGLEPG